MAPRRLTGNFIGRAAPAFSPLSVASRPTQTSTRWRDGVACAPVAVRRQPDRIRRVAKGFRGLHRCAQRHCLTSVLKADHLVVTSATLKVVKGCEAEEARCGS
jgi:hypothetical protein